MTKTIKCACCSVSMQMEIDEDGLAEFKGLQKLLHVAICCESCSKHHRRRRFLEERLAWNAQQAHNSQFSKTTRGQAAHANALQEIRSLLAQWSAEQIRFYKMPKDEWRTDVLVAEAMMDIEANPLKWRDVCDSLTQNMRSEHQQIYGTDRKEHGPGFGLPVGS